MAKKQRKKQQIRPVKNSQKARKMTDRAGSLAHWEKSKYWVKNAIPITRQKGKQMRGRSKNVSPKKTI
jgi:hypothetical protein